MTYLPDFRLETYFAQWEFNARYHLTASDMQTLSMRELLEWATPADRAAWDTLSLGYTQSPGDPTLRQAIAATYDTADPADVLCFAGAEEGLFCAMHALLGRDDHAIVTTPNYQSMETLPLHLCGAVSGVRLHEEDHWNLNLDEIKAALRPNTRLIAVNFPNNPTGKVIDPHTWRCLLELAAERDIYVFADEVYRGLERDPAHTLVQAVDGISGYTKALSLGVMSKALGMPGLRIGWIACKDHALLSKMERIKHYLSICNSASSEILARIALAARERILARNLNIVRANLVLLDAFFAEFTDRFDWVAPEGGCVAYPRYKGTDGVEVFCKTLVEQSGVLLLPASIYRSDLQPVPADHFRIGFGHTNTEVGLQALRAHLLQ